MSELHQAGLHAAIAPVGTALAKQIAAKHYCVPDLVAAAVSSYLLTAQPILATTEELEELDAGALVVDAEGKPWLKQEDEDLTWWVTLLSEEGYPATAIALPAQLIRLQPGAAHPEAMSTDQHRRMQANFRLTHDHKAHPEYRQALDLLVDTAISHAGKDRVTMDHALSDAFSEAIKLIAPSLLEQVPPVQVAAGDTLSEDDVRRHHPPYTGFDHLDTVPAADRWTKLCILPEGTVILDPESGYIWVCAFGNLGGEDRWALAYPHHESDFDGPAPSIPDGPGPLIVLHRGQGRLR